MQDNPTTDIAPQVQNLLAKFQDQLPGFSEAVDQSSSIQPQENKVDRIYREMFGGEQPQQTPGQQQPPSQREQQYFDLSGERQQLTRQKRQLESEGRGVHFDQIQQKSARLKEIESEISELKPEGAGIRLINGLNNFISGAAEMPAGALKGVAVLAKQIDNKLGTNFQPGDVSDQQTYKWGQQISELAKKHFPTDPVLQEEFTQQLAAGLGSFLSFGLGGLGARAVTGSLRGGQVFAVTAAGTGGVGQQYDEAIQHGATEEDAILAGNWGFLPGVVQVSNTALRVLNRWDRQYGGALKENLARRILESGKTGINEAIVETLGQAGYNKIAQEIYDAERPLIEGLSEAGSVGGSAGFLSDLLMSAFLGRGARGTSQPGGSDRPSPSLEQVRIEMESGNDALSPAEIEAQQQELEEAQQPLGVGLYNKQEVTVIGQDGQGDLYIRHEDGRQEHVQKELLTDFVSREELEVSEAIVEGAQAQIEQQQQTIQDPETGEFYSPEDPQYEQVAQKVQQQLANQRQLTVGEGDARQSVTLNPLPGGNFQVTQVDGIPVSEMTATETNSLVNRITQELEGRGEFMVEMFADPSDSMGPMQIVVIAQPGSDVEGITDGAVPQKAVTADQQAVDGTPQPEIEAPEQNLGAESEPRPIDSYDVVADGMKLSVLNPEGKEVGKKSKHYFPKLIDYFSQTAGIYSNMPRVTDTNQNITEQNFTQEVARSSENPVEIAEAYQVALQQSENEQAGAIKERFIAEDLLSSRLPPSDFKGRDVDNPIYYAQYTSRDSEVDLAMRADYLSDQLGMEVTEQDIVDFIFANPGGPRSVLNKKPEIQSKLEERFKEVTGVELSPGIAQVLYEAPPSGTPQQTVEQEFVTPETDVARQAELEQMGETEIAELEQQLLDQQVADEELQRIREQAETIDEQALADAEAAVENATTEAEALAELENFFDQMGMQADTEGRFARPAEQTETQTEVQADEQTQAVEAENQGVPETAEAAESGTAVEGEETPKASTQFNIEGELAQRAVEFAESIPEAELYNPEGETRFGREDEPHVTLFYGLTESNPQSVQELLAEAGDVDITFGKTSLFENPDYDVLKVEVEGGKLRELHNRIKENLPNETTFPDYNPHMTIAYLQPGEGQKYVDDARFEGESVRLSEVLYSSPEREKTTIDLSETTPQETEPQQRSLNDFFDQQEQVDETASITEQVDQTETTPEPQQTETDQTETTTEQTAEQTEEATPQEKIEDFGEKIGGARKDLYQEYSRDLGEISDDALANRPLSEVFPEPNFEQLIEDGVLTRSGAIFLKISRDVVARSKPRSRYKKQRWVQQAREVVDMLKDAVEGNKETLMAIYNEIQKNPSFRDTMVLHRMFKESAWPAESFNPGKIRLYESGERGMRPRGSKPFYVVDGSLIRGDFDTYADGMARVQQLIDQKNKKSGKVKFDVYSRRGEDGYMIAKKMGTRKHVVVKEGLESVRAAREYIQENQAELEDIYNSKKDIPEHRRATNQNRVGEDYRGGRDVTTDDFQQTFGFRAGEFGNWVNQSEAQDNLNDTYDALMDMANVLGVEPRALSLSGELAMAWGARGRGGVDAAMAHYEPGKIVINLTKKQGAGSLAHEWFHALDNYFARQAGERTGFVTRNPIRFLRSDREIRPQMGEAFRNIMDTIRKETDMAKRAKELDKLRSKDYWSTNVELSARAFEWYVRHRLAAEGNSNDYLVNLVSEENYGMPQAYPYVSQKEADVVAKAFDNFFSEIQQEKTGDDVTLFSFEADGVPTSSLDVHRQNVRDAVQNVIKGWAYRDFVHVVDNAADAPAHIQAEIAASPKGRRVKGIFNNDGVWLIADNIRNADEALATLAHESIGHMGIRLSVANLSESRAEFTKRMDELLGEVHNAFKDTPLYRQTANKYGADLRSKHGRNLTAEEYLARLSEGDIQPSLRQKIVQFVNDLLRALGLDVKMTEADVFDLIKASREIVESGDVGRVVSDGGRLRTGFFQLTDGQQASESEINYTETSQLEQIGARDERTTFGELGRAQENRNTVADQARERTVQGWQQPVDQRQADLFDRGAETVSEGQAPPQVETPGGIVYQRPILEGFQESGYVNIIGSPVTGPQDLADLYSIHRSPLIEKFHFVGLDADNKVVYSSAITSNASTYVVVDEKMVSNALQELKDTGAVKVSLVHNHPSGNPKESQADLRLTAKVHSVINLFAEEQGIEMSFENHVVLDGDQFTNIDRDGNAYLLDYKTKPKDFYKEGRDKTNYDNPDDLATLGRLLLQEDDAITVIYLNNQLNAAGYDVFPISNRTVEDISNSMKEMRDKGQVVKVAFVGNTDSLTEISGVQFPIDTVDVLDFNPKTGRYTSLRTIQPHNQMFKDTPKPYRTPERLWEPEARYNLQETEGAIQQEIDPETGMSIADYGEQRKVPGGFGRLARLKGLFIEPLHWLEQKPQLKPLADKVRNHYDDWARRRGKAYGRAHERVLIPLSKLKRKQRNEILDQFEEYMRLRETGSKQQAEDMTLHPLAQEMVDYTTWLGHYAGSINRQVGVQVFDANMVDWNAIESKVGADGVAQIKKLPYESRDAKYSELVNRKNSRLPRTSGWRDIGQVKDFFPRKLNAITQATLRNPDKNIEHWNAIVDALLDEGFVETRAEADKYLKTYWSDYSERNYFAGIEKARAQALPSIAYDYRFMVMLDYMNSWSERVSQIQHFGQVTTPDTKDAFDQYRTQVADEATRNFIKALRDRVYNQNANDGFHQGISVLNKLATGLQLGNFGTASLNLIGGTTLNFMANPTLPSLKALLHLAKPDFRPPRFRGAGFMRGLSDMVEFKNLADRIQEGRTRGAINTDMIMLLRDTNNVEGFIKSPQVLQQLGLPENISVNEALDRFVNATMKWGGYIPTEMFIRSHAQLSAKYALGDKIADIKKNATSRKSLKHIRSIQEHGFDYRRLVAEGGEGIYTDRYIRYMSNLTQGSYKVDQVPIHLDTPTGRFFFKYVKFITQVSRMWYKDFYRPFAASALEGGSKVQVEVDGVMTTQRVYEFTKMMKFFAASAIGGELVRNVRALLFDYAFQGPEIEEIEKALEDDDTMKALALIFDRAFWNIQATGGLLIFGNYAQLTRDAFTRQRARNPLEPPGFGVLKNTIDFGLDTYDQKGITARDIDRFVERQFSLYRTSKRPVLKAYSKLEEEIDLPEWHESRLRDFERDRNYVRNLVRRWEEEENVQGGQQRVGRVSRTENTITNNRIHEALATGHPYKAVEILLIDSSRRGRDFERMRRSAMTSMRHRRPYGNMSQSNTAAFNEWLTKTLKEDSALRVQDIEQEYRDSASEFELVSGEILNRIRPIDNNIERLEENMGDDPVVQREIEELLKRRQQVMETLKQDIDRRSQAAGMFRDQQRQAQQRRALNNFIEP